MKRVTAAVVIVALVLLVVAWLVLRAPTSQTPVGTGSLSGTSGTLGTAPTGGNTTSVTSQGTATAPAEPKTVASSVEGGSVTVQDFTPAAAPDSSRSGIYYLSGTDANGFLVQGAPYEISYHEKDQSFTVSLFAEPLGQVRAEAQRDLMKKLGITENQACVLKYVVLVPFDVNPLFAGYNLGFSFCPGAIQLP